MNWVIDAALVIVGIIVWFCGMALALGLYVLMIALPFIAIGAGIGIAATAMCWFAPFC